MTAEATEKLFAVRAMRTEDHAFVKDSWLQQDRFRGGRMDGVGYFRKQKARIRLVLTRPTTVGMVACDRDDDDAIVGWSVTAPALHVVYYVFVREGARRLGLARRLLGALAAERCKFCHWPAVRGVTIPATWTYDRGPLLGEEAA